MSERTVVPKIGRLSEDEFHGAAIRCISNCIDDHGEAATAKAMEVSTRQLRNILAGSTPGARRLHNLLSLDPHALDPIDRHYGQRRVPRDAVCSSDPISERLARLLARMIQMERADSPEGERVALGELLSLTSFEEDDLRFIAAETAGMVERIDSYRSGGGANVTDLRTAGEAKQ